MPGRLEAGRSNPAPKPRSGRQTLGSDDCNLSILEMAAYYHFRGNRGSSERLRTIGHIRRKELAQTTYRRAGEYRAKDKPSVLSQYLRQHRRATRQSWR